MRRDPYLPQNDPKPTERADQLRSRAEPYEYVPKPAEPAPADARQDTGTWVRTVTAAHLAVAATVPFSQEYSLPFLAKVLGLDVKVRENHLAAELEGLSPSADEHEALAKRSSDDFSKATLFGARPHEILRHLFFRSTHEAADRVTDAERRFDDYAKLFAAIERTPIVDWFARPSEDQDRLFAWQRIAGVNPMTLRRVTERLPDHFPVPAETYARVVAGDSLEAALQEGRLYLCDYAALDGIEVQEGRCLWAPMALFAWQRPSGSAPGGALVPVAIQCGQQPGPETPLWTPLDGYRWRMARRVVDIADANEHQAVAHLGRTHMTLEPFIVSAFRKLAPNHPLSVLLEPHFEFTLAINNTAAHSLIAPGGAVETVLGGTLEASIALAASPLPGFRASRWRPDAELAGRGLLELPVHPYRDDTLPVWKAIHDWVEAYLRLYYHGDADVQADRELKEFLDEVRSPAGGRLSSLEPVDTVAGLAELAAFVVWTASAQHAAVNFPQFSFLAYNPNVAGAAYAPRPVSTTPETEASWVDMMAPLSNAVVQFDILYQLSSLKMGILGEYKHGTFRDERVNAPLAAFQRALAAAEMDSLARDGGRLMSYPWLRSSNITHSIHI